MSVRYYTTTNGVSIKATPAGDLRVGAKYVAADPCYSGNRYTIEVSARSSTGKFTLIKYSACDFVPCERWVTNDTDYVILDTVPDKVAL